MFALYELLDFRVIACCGQQMVVNILFVVVLGLKVLREAAPWVGHTLFTFLIGITTCDRKSSCLLMFLYKN